MARPVNPLFRGPDGKFSTELYDKWHYEQNKDRRKKQSAEYRKNNLEKARLAVRNWISKNKEKKQAIDKEHYEANKEKYFANAVKRRAQKLRAFPSWLSKEDKKEISKIYKKSITMNKAAGKIVVHVDHIVPLQGENVSGLHVPWNLQILSATENLSKWRNF